MTTLADYINTQRQLIESLEKVQVIMDQMINNYKGLLELRDREIERQGSYIKSQNDVIITGNALIESQKKQIEIYEKYVRQL